MIITSRWPVGIELSSSVFEDLISRYIFVVHRHSERNKRRLFSYFCSRHWFWRSTVCWCHRVLPVKNLEYKIKLCSSILLFLELHFGLKHETITVQGIWPTNHGSAISVTVFFPLSYDTLEAFKYILRCIGSLFELIQLSSLMVWIILGTLRWIAQKQCCVTGLCPTTSGLLRYISWRESSCRSSGVLKSVIIMRSSLFCRRSLWLSCWNIA